MGVLDFGTTIQFCCNFASKIGIRHHGGRVVVQFEWIALQSEERFLVLRRALDVVSGSNHAKRSK